MTVGWLAALWDEATEASSVRMEYQASLSAGTNRISSVIFLVFCTFSTFGRMGRESLVEIYSYCSANLRVLVKKLTCVLTNILCFVIIALDR